MNIKILLQGRILKKIAIVLMLLVGVVLILDIPNIQIDRYNFEQLEKAKPILESIPVNAKKFYTLKEFNEQYKADIKPINNCYLVGNNNGNQKYIFGFQLKSKVYKLLYSNYFYVYPKYDVKKTTICNNISCNDASFTYFIGVISHPCKD